MRNDHSNNEIFSDWFDQDEEYNFEIAKGDDDRHHISSKNNFTQFEIESENKPYTITK